MAKPDFMVMVPDLYHRRRRHQGRRRLHCHPPEPQGHFLTLIRAFPEMLSLFLVGRGSQTTLPSTSPCPCNDM